MSALKGLTVVDFTQGEAGPRAIAMLADMGADVIKIEPPTGEYTRLHTRYWDEGNGANAYFLSHNRNKRAISLDYKKPEGRNIIYKLVKKADIFAHSWSPGMAERHGYGYDDLYKINPKIIYASLSSWGKKGPMGACDGVDIVTQAACGLTHQNGMEGGAECPLPTSIVDQLTGLALAFGIMVALYHRKCTGEGQQIDCSLLNTSLYSLSLEICAYLLSGKPMSKSGRGHSMEAGLYMNFPCKDSWIAFGGVRNESWTAICQAMGLEHLISDPRFVGTDDRDNHRDELIPILDERFRTKTAIEWTEILEKAGATVSPIYSIEEMLSDPKTKAQIEANEMLVEVEKSGGGRTKIVGPIVNLSRTPGKIRRGDFTVGQDTFDVMSELDFTPEQITQFYLDEVL